jgi:hypothetical protein
MSSNRVRWGGLAAISGGMLGILYSPFVALAFFATKDGAKFADNLLVAAWTGVARPALEPFLSFSSPGYVHLIYGGLLVFVILGLREGLKALHLRQAARAERLETWGFRVALFGSVFLTIGSIGAFWSGGLVFALSHSHTDLVTNASYVAFSLPGLLFFMFGTTLFGIGALRARLAPRLGAWLLMSAASPG